MRLEHHLIALKFTPDPFLQPSKLDGGKTAFFFDFFLNRTFLPPYTSGGARISIVRSPWLALI